MWFIIYVFLLGCTVLKLIQNHLEGEDPSSGNPRICPLEDLEAISALASYSLPNPSPETPS